LLHACAGILLFFTIFSSKQQEDAAAPDMTDVESADSVETKLELLTKAFQSLSEKKSKMETSFQADKKSIVVSKPASFSSLLLDCLHPYLVNIVSFFYKQLSCLACLAEK